MDWQELPGAKTSRIAITKEMKDIKDPKQIEEAYGWYKEKWEKISNSLFLISAAHPAGGRKSRRKEPGDK